MKKHGLLLQCFVALSFVVVGSSVIAKSPVAKQAVKEKDFVSIFDGKTLEGWEAMPKNTAPAWVVKDGMIVGDGDKGRGYLVYSKDKHIADLELRFRYRFPGEGNSGVSIRAVPDPTGKRDFQSYHADLGHVGIGKQVLGAWDFHTPGRTEHRCFLGDKLVIDKNDKPHITEVKDGLTVAGIKKGEWNDARVVAKDNQFRFYINGKLASEFTEHLDPKKRLDAGMIQLQLHDPGMIVHFKDVRLKILKSKKTDTNQERSKSNTIK